MTKRQAVIIDLDGTLASSSWRDMVLSRPHATDPEWDRSFELSADDPLVEPVADFARTAAENHIDVVIVTGRPERYRAVFTQWLDRHNVPYSALLLRADDDRRPAWQTKGQLVQRHVLDRWTVLGAVEDDPKVAGAYAELGIGTTLVSDPNLFPTGPRLAPSSAYAPPSAPQWLSLDFELQPPVHRQAQAPAA
ncbi:MAG: hypothetical protein R2754_16495 [Microthrixaceae bacterium]